MKEPVMSIAAWIILGLAAGLLASRLAPELRAAEPPALLAVIGIAGAVAGGWTASILIAGPLAGGFLSPATWPAAVAGAAALLAARRFLTGRRREPRRQAVIVPARRPREPR
jgi:uncharacterized membrane protein YeaQ/YmgE (transglycosylase-associated protein family)